MCIQPVASDSDAASDKKIFETLENFYCKLVGKMKGVSQREDETSAILHKHSR